MPRPETCYFTLSHGLRGCYMPDAHYGPYAMTTRTGIAYAIRETLEMCGAPKSAIRQIKLRDLWKHAKRCGTSSIHFTIDTGKGYGLNFHGLTEAEYNEQNSED